MTRFSSLFVATTLAIMPLSAFAQTSANAPAKTTAATGITAPAPTIAPNKSTATAADTKAPVQTKKSELHSLNNHHEKTSVPAKSAEPAKS